MVGIVPVAVIGLPSHRFLTRRFDLIRQVSGDISRAIINLSVLRMRVPKVMREEILSLECGIKIRSGEPVTGKAKAIPPQKHDG